MQCATLQGTIRRSRSPPDRPICPTADASRRLLDVITVVDHDPRWVDRFEALRTEYAAAFAAARVPVVAIEHVGSTSVEGLAAKPVIDSDIVIAAEDVVAASAVLVGLGFVPRG